DVINSIDDCEQISVLDLWTDVAGGLVIQTTNLWFGRAASEFSREATPPKRAPNDSADTLIFCQRHQLPLIIAAHQRIVRLMGNVARPAVTIRNGQRFHQ